MFGSENFEKISSNWDQLVLFNKMIIIASCKHFIGWFTYNKEPLKC